MPSIGRVRAALRKLPNVEEGTTFGYPAFKIGGKAFAWFPKKKEVEPDTLAVRMSLLERDYRMRASPTAYYVTPHYKDYPCVLARPTALDDAELRELLESAYEFMIAEARRKVRRPRL
ncbi:MAG: MmcQ/YjbR family DNA-binding protein [Gemmatimonadaceae bacterium]